MIIPAVTTALAGALCAPALSAQTIPDDGVEIVRPAQHIVCVPTPAPGVIGAAAAGADDPWNELFDGKEIGRVGYPQLEPPSAAGAPRRLCAAVEHPPQKPQPNSTTSEHEATNGRGYYCLGASLNACLQTLETAGRIPVAQLIEGKVNTAPWYDAAAPADAPALAKALFELRSFAARSAKGDAAEKSAKTGGLVAARDWAGGSGFKFGSCDADTRLAGKCKEKPSTNEPSGWSVWAPDAIVPAAK